MGSFEIRKNEFLPACVMATSMVIKSPVAEHIMTGIRFDFVSVGHNECEVTLSCTDLQNSYFAKAGVVNATHEESFWVVDSKVLLGTIRALEETAIIDVGENAIVVKDVSNDITTTIPIVVDDAKCNFPTDLIYDFWDIFEEDWQQENTPNKLGEKHPSMKRAISDLRPIAQRVDETRVHMCGIFFEGGKAIATDGHVMAVRNCPSPYSSEQKKEGVLVSKKSLSLLQKILSPDITVVFEKNNIVFCDNKEEFALSTPILSDNFPPWREVVPDKKTLKKVGTINAKEMKNVLAESMSIVGGSSCTLLFEKNLIKVKGKGLSPITREFYFDIDVEEKIFFNTLYVKNAFETLGKEEVQDVQVFLGGPNDPMMLDDGNGNFNIIMPLRF